MKRRDFLIKSASFLMGSLVGLDGLTKAFAASHTPRMALIIDDIGHSVSKARSFLELGIPITFAVLPKLPHSAELALELHREGHEIMLHQPMEPCDRGLDPGPGALYVGDGALKIGRVMQENLSEIPFAKGVNNHMGSRFTASKKETFQAIGVLQETSLFFVDSLTSSRSVAYETARRLHVPAAIRHVFLDHYPSEEAIFSSLERLRMHTLRYGRGIGIGHPFPETAKAIGRFVEGLKDSDVSLVYVSRLASPV